MEKVFDEVVYPEELTLKKWTMWPLLSLTKLVTRFNQITKSLSILKFVTFTVHRDSADDDVNNNIHPLPPLKSAFQNSCNKVAVKFSEDAPSPRFTGEFFC
jgi:hypothetical protein